MLNKNTNEVRRKTGLQIRYSMYYNKCTQFVYYIVKFTYVSLENMTTLGTKLWN